MMAGCISNECLERIIQIAQLNDSMTADQHECQYHPEIKKSALTDPCEDFIELRNEIGEAESEARKACDCKKLKEVV
jgi:hypothetical protein